MNMMGQNMVHKLVIFWSYYGQNMYHVYIGANYGQNMDHKLVKIWAKLDHGKVGAKYGQSMVHKLGKIWAIFGPISDKVFRVLVVYGICDK